MASYGCFQVQCFIASISALQCSMTNGNQKSRHYKVILVIMLRIQSEHVVYMLFGIHGWFQVQCFSTSISVLQCSMTNERQTIPRKLRHDAQVKMSCYMLMSSDGCFQVQRFITYTSMLNGKGNRRHRYCQQIFHG